MSYLRKMLSDDLALMAEWDYEKNSQIDPAQITRNSTKNIWWKCSLCGASWCTSPHNRRRPHCAACNRKEIPKQRILRAIEKNGSLQETFPELMAEWDYVKNDLLEIFPNEISAKSNKKVNWICAICGYEWSTDIAHRTEGTGCPCCAGRVTVSGVNDLATINPNLASEWSSKNEKSASEITVRSGVNVWWKCSACGHEWKSTVSNRTAGNNCPKCKGNNTSFVEQCIYYYLSQAFISTKNRYIEPTTKMEIDVFIEELNIGIEYDGYRFHNSEEKRITDDIKTKALQSIGISMIRVRETIRHAQCNHLPMLQVAPDGFIEHHPRKRFESTNNLINELLIQIIKIAKIDAIILDVDIKRDRFEILHKMYQGRTENSLLLINPSVAELWDYNKNNPLLPSEVTSKSSLRVHWKCPICQYEWETAISNQMTSRGCPQCNNSVVSDQYNFAFLYPELLEEWDYTANDILPNALMPFSHEKRGWVCKVCGHKWQSSTAHRIDGNGCPECAKEKSRLAILKPVSQFSKDKRELMAQYESARAAERATNIGYKQISACCCGTKPSAGGYWWCFSMDIK